MNKFHDRCQAGRALAEELKSYVNITDVIVLALPRGGVPVGYEIAKALAVGFDIFIVRKLGVPGYEELAMGAIAMSDIIVFNDDIIQGLNISKAVIEQEIQIERQELQRREIIYRQGWSFPKLANKTIILVDDGIATGATMRAAIMALRQRKPAEIIVAIPVAAVSTCAEIALLVDELICPLRPSDFYSVGAWYINFSQTTDAEVQKLFVAINNKDAI